MNYIKLINNIWDMREQGLVTQHECDLYCYLVHRSNKLEWENPFCQSTEVLCAVLGINRDALLVRRNKLRKMGLINFKEGTTKTKPAQYELYAQKRAAPRKSPPKAKKKDVHPKPALLQVIDWCSQQQYMVDGKVFSDHYNDRNWTINGRRIVNWKALLAKWEKRLQAEIKKNDCAKQGKSISHVQF